MKKAFVMTAIMAGTFVGSGFGAVGGAIDMGYVERKKPKPVASTVNGLSERERIAAMELETARLNLKTAEITSGKTSSKRPITEKDLPKSLEDFQPNHVEFVRDRAKEGVVKYQHLMGRMYARGEGLSRNDEKAAVCFRVAYYNYGYEKSGDALRTLIETDRIKAKDAEEKRRLGII
jgi:hypothetical protein